MKTVMWCCVNPAACHLLGMPNSYHHDQYPLYTTQPDLFELLKFEDLKSGEKFQFESQQSQYHIQVLVTKTRCAASNADLADFTRCTKTQSASATT